MAPVFGTPNFEFNVDSSEVISENDSYEGIAMREVSLTEMALYYTVFLLGLLLMWLLIYFCLKLLGLGQKTREPQQRRMYVGSRVRPSLGQSPPTIYVSPSNLPPPPKYEAMAPPSYEEVVGIHYPNYQPPIGQSISVQPITQPILTAVAQGSSTNQSTTAQPTTVTISSETRRTSVNVASQ